jgi:aldehyde dehydrogenase (NAD+)
MKYHPLLIDGQWCDTGTTLAHHNPSDLDDVVGEFAQADAALARQAVAAACAAQPRWRAAGIQARSDALDRIGTEILARRAELGDLLAREEGKTLPEAVAETVRAGQIFKFFAGEALRLPGEALPSVRSGLAVEVLREPVGVVTLVTPWNFPIAIPAWKIAPALAFGNAVVFKPSEWAPACAWALAEIIHRAGLPPGAFNLVMGGGAEVGAALTGHPQVDAISFTGSVATGRAVLQAASRHWTKVQLEMGGKNPLLVLADADLDQAVEVAVQGSFFSTGQRCTASSRLIVEQPIVADFTARLLARLRALKVDDARKPGTDIGPLANPAQWRKSQDYIAIAQAEGAVLACGGEPLRRERRGHYLSPALFTSADAGMRIAREEVFGPVACVIEARDYEHGLALANDSEFGLSAGLCTRSLKHAQHFKLNSSAGMVMVNAPTAGVDYHVPFGGRKGSSYGPREQGRAAADLYTVSRTVYVNA